MQQPEQKNIYLEPPYFNQDTGVLDLVSNRVDAPLNGYNDLIQSAICDSRVTRCAMLYDFGSLLLIENALIDKISRKHIVLVVSNKAALTNNKINFSYLNSFYNLKILFSNSTKLDLSQNQNLLSPQEAIVKAKSGEELFNKNLHLEEKQEEKLPSDSLSTFYVSDHYITKSKDRFQLNSTVYDIYQAEEAYALVIKDNDFKGYLISNHDEFSRNIQRKNVRYLFISEQLFLDLIEDRNYVNHLLLPVLKRLTVVGRYPFRIVLVNKEYEKQTNKSFIQKYFKTYPSIETFCTQLAEQDINSVHVHISNLPNNQYIGPNLSEDIIEKIQLKKAMEASLETLKPTTSQQQPETKSESEPKLVQSSPNPNPIILIIPLKNDKLGKYNLFWIDNLNVLTTNIPTQILGLSYDLFSKNKQVAQLLNKWLSKPKHENNKILLVDDQLTQRDQQHFDDLLNQLQNKKSSFLLTQAKPVHDQQFNESIWGLTKFELPKPENFLVKFNNSPETNTIFELYNYEIAYKKYKSPLYNLNPRTPFSIYFDTHFNQFKQVINDHPIKYIFISYATFLHVTDHPEEGLLKFLESRYQQGHSKSITLVVVDPEINNYLDQCLDRYHKIHDTTKNFLTFNLSNDNDSIGQPCLTYIQNHRRTGRQLKSRTAAIAAASTESKQETQQEMPKQPDLGIFRPYFDPENQEFDLHQYELSWRRKTLSNSDLVENEDIINHLINNNKISDLLLQIIISYPIQKLTISFTLLRYFTCSSDFRAALTKLNEQSSTSIIICHKEEDQGALQRLRDPIKETYPRLKLSFDPLLLPDSAVIQTTQGQKNEADSDNEIIVLDDILSQPHQSQQQHQTKTTQPLQPETPTEISTEKLTPTTTDEQHQTKTSSQPQPQQHQTKTTQPQSLQLEPTTSTIQKNNHLTPTKLDKVTFMSCIQSQDLILTSHNQPEAKGVQGNYLNIYLYQSKSQDYDLTSLFNDTEYCEILEQQQVKGLFLPYAQYKFLKNSEKHQLNQWLIKNDSKSFIILDSYSGNLKDFYQKIKNFPSESQEQIYRGNFYIKNNIQELSPTSPSENVINPEPAKKSKISYLAKNPRLVNSVMGLSSALLIFTLLFVWLPMSTAFLLTIPALAWYGPIGFTFLVAFLFRLSKTCSSQAKYTAMVDLFMVVLLLAIAYYTFTLSPAAVLMSVVIVASVQMIGLIIQFYCKDWKQAHDKTWLSWLYTITPLLCGLATAIVVVQPAWLSLLVQLKIATHAAAFTWSTVALVMFIIIFISSAVKAGLTAQAQHDNKASTQEYKLPLRPITVLPNSFRASSENPTEKSFRSFFSCLRRNSSSYENMNETNTDGNSYKSGS